MFIQTLHRSQPAGSIGDSEIFFSGFAKSPRVLRSSWILNKCNSYFKIVKYCVLSKVCMIKKAPHSTVSPQVMYKKCKRLVYTPPDLLGRFCKERKKDRLPLFSRPNLLQLRASLWLLSVIEDDSCFLGGVHIRLSTRCKILFTLGLFANYFS